LETLLGSKINRREYSVADVADIGSGLYQVSSWALAKQSTETKRSSTFSAGCLVFNTALNDV